MSQNISRRNVVKALGAGATVAGTSTLSASAVSGGDPYPVIYATKNVDQKYDRFSVMGEIAYLLWDSYNFNTIDYGETTPDFSNETTTDGVVQAFDDYVTNTVSDASAETNILLTDEEKYTDRRVGYDGDVTVINGAKAFANNPDPSRYGSDEATKRYWSLLVGVGRNYGVGFQQGRVYKDSSVTSDYIRTPMTGFNQSLPDDTLTTNDCGTQTYENDTFQTLDLRWTDCSVQTVDANHG